MVWSSFNFYLKLGQVLGLVPWINLNTFELSENFLYKMYPAILTITIFMHQFLHIISSKDVINVSLVFLACTIGFTSLRSVYLNRAEWRHMCHLLKFINKNKHELVDSIDLGIKPVVIFVLYFLSTLSIRIAAYYNNFGEFDLIVDLLLFVSLTRDCLSIYFLSTLRKGFKILNNHTKYLLNGCLTSDFGNPKLNGTTPALCKNFYEILYEMSLCIKEIFGWMVASSLLMLLVRMILSIQKILNVTVMRRFSAVEILRFILVITSRLVSSEDQSIR